LRLGLWSYWSLFMADAAKGVTDPRNDAVLLRSIEILRRFHALSAYSLYGSGPALGDDFFRRGGAILAGYSSFMCAAAGNRGWRAEMIPVENGGRLTCETCVCCIGSGSKRREEAWLFVKYLASAEAQRKLARAGVNFPALTEVMLEMGRTPALEGLGLSAALEKAERIPLSSQILYILYENIIDPVLEKYFEGGLSVSSVLDIVRPRVSEILRVYLRNC